MGSYPKILRKRLLYGTLIELGVVAALVAISFCFPGIITWTDSHNGLVTALATITVAGFTAMLYFVTNKSVNLARDEFVATFRPKPEIRFVRKVKNGAELTVINEGTTPARFVSARALLVPVGNPEAIPSPHDISEKGSFELRARFDVSASDTATITQVADKFKAGYGGELYLFGWIVYESIGSTPACRITYFGRNIRQELY